MKTRLFIIISVIMVLSSIAAAAPQMRVPEKVFDFGFVPQHSQATCRFWIYSDGTDTLRITDVRPACGCTKAPLEKKIIPPGDSTFVDITFNTGQYNGRTSKAITITAADSIPSQRVTILSTVLPDSFVNSVLLIKPMALDLTGVGKGQEITFTIENKTQEEVKPQMALTPQGMVEINLPKKIRPGESARGSIKTLNAIPPEYAKSFTFSIGDTENGKFTIPLRGKPAEQVAKPAKTAVKPN